MNITLEQRLKDLEAKRTAGTITPEEEVVRVSLLELDEASENKDDADKVLADAVAANTPPVVPQPVVDAQANVVVAQTAEDAALKAYNDAELKVLAAVTPAV